jgi:hypothetical protein
MHRKPLFLVRAIGLAGSILSAEGVVIAVRRERNQPKANLAFWSAAVDYELRRKGYSAIASKDVKSAQGVPGKQIR